MVFRVCLIVTVAILAVSVLYAGSRPAEAKDKVASRGSESPVAKGSGPNSVAISLKEAKHAIEYWTPKRMANATPMPLQQGSPSPRGILDQALPPNSSSPPVRAAAPVPPSDHTNNRRRQGAGPEVSTPAAAAPAAETPADLWTGPTTRPPVTTTGKLFATFDYNHTPNDPYDDTHSECTASTVNSPAKNLVFTAGHCVRNTKTNDEGKRIAPWSDRVWGYDVKFVPAHPHKDATSTQPLYGEWAAQSVVVHEEWEKSGDIGRDVAAVQVWPSKLTGGELLVDEVGANGIRFNEPAQQDAYAFGYPSNLDPEANTLYYCHDQSKYGGIIYPTMAWMICDMEHGASGGPWLMNFNGETGDLFAVSSSRCGAFWCDSRGLQGPLFDESIRNIYEKIVGTDFPSPGSIAYTRYDGNDQEIYTISPTGGTPFQVTDNTTNEFDPSLSPDGTQIAYQGYDGDDQEIYTINSAGGTPFQVTYNTTDDGAPSYSPDGTHIAYEGDDGNDLQIYTINSTGGKPFKVTDAPINHYSPAYSPDGKKIAFSQRECTRCDTEIFTINSAGGTPFQQVTDNTTWDYAPTFSPISTWIAFSGSDGKDDEIFRVFSPEDPATHYEPRQITYNDTNEFEASYSPDGYHIVYSSYDGHDTELYTMNLIYGHVRKLTNTDTDERSPSWGIARKTEVPDVVGFYSSGAGQRIRNAGLVPKFTGDPPGGNAWVRSQSPSPHTIVDRGSTVTCRLTNVGHPN